MMYDFNLIDRYAGALYQVADTKGKLLHVVKDMDVFQQFIQVLPKYFVYLGAVITKFSIQKSVIQVLTKHYKLSEITENFLLTLCINGRFGCLQQVLTRFFELYQEGKGIRVVEVKSVTKLTDNQIKLLKQHLEKKEKKEIILNLVVDPAILGGLIIKSGSKVIDDSIINKINKIRFNTIDFIN